MGNELRNHQVRFLLERYEIQAQALDVLVMEALLQAEAERQGLADVDALLEAEVDAEVPEPTDAEIRAFWPVLERQMRGATFEEARPVVVDELVRRAREERYAAFLDELRRRADLRIRLPYPELPKAEVPVAAHDPAMGPEDAPVTVVQFAEYQCFYCARVTETLDQLVATYGERVRVVWKDFPLSSHGRAIPAAVAAHCAGEQGRYWEMNRLLLDHQHALSDADIAGYAGDLSLDGEAFQACLTSGRFESAIRADVDVGEALGVEATPTFFVNGVLLSGAQPYERFASLVERELQARQALTDAGDGAPAGP